MACLQIREILQADRAASSRKQAAQDGSKEPGSREGGGGAAGLAAAAPDQAARQGSMDSWQSAESVLDVDTDSSSQGDASSSIMSPRGSSASGNSSGAALAQQAAGEPKEVEVVKQEESSYRPIMWCA